MDDKLEQEKADIADLLSLKAHLTAWEFKFLHSVNSWNRQGKLLSQKQAAVVAKLKTTVNERME